MRSIGFVTVARTTNQLMAHPAATPTLGTATQTEANPKPMHANAAAAIMPATATHNPAKPQLKTGRLLIGRRRTSACMERVGEAWALRGVTAAPFEAALLPISAILALPAG
jgi:hypothetical protein